MNRRDAPWDVATVVVGAALAGLSSLSAPFHPFDETWFLQVTSRVSAGEVLYRDVFYGATPLAVYVSRAAAVPFGAEAGVMRALLAACFMAIVVAAVAVARRLGVRGAGLLLVALGTLAYGQLLGSRTSFYSPLATLLGLVTLWLVLAPRHHTLLAGVAAGCAFAAKQNVGLLLLAALGASVVSRHRLSAPRGAASLPRELVLVSVGFVATAGVLLLPVLLEGGGPKLLEYGFFAKGDYLRAAGVSYWDGVVRSVTSTLGTRSLRDAKAAYEELLFLLPLLVVAGLGMAWRIGQDARATTLTVAAFVAAAFAATLPRCDAYHLAAAVPVLLVALAYALNVVSSSAPRHAVPWALTMGAVAWMAVGTGSHAAFAVQRLRSTRSRPVPFPHFRGTVGDVSAVRALTDRVAALRALVPAGESPFLLSAAAGFYYLGSGLRNPTPFDYPYVTALGGAGEGGIIAALEKGEITLLCLDVSDSRRASNPLWPHAIERHARLKMRLVTAHEDWEVYRAEPASAAPSSPGTSATRQVGPPSARVN